MVLLSFNSSKRARERAHLNVRKIQKNPEGVGEGCLILASFGCATQETLFHLRHPPHAGK